MNFQHNRFGFSLQIPDGWRVASHQDQRAIAGYTAQKSEDDLPGDGDFKTILVIQEILTDEHDRIRCHFEMTVWKNEPFKLPSRAKRYPIGELQFKARVGSYGNGGEHAAGQLDVGDGFVLHITVWTDEPEATKDLKAVLATVKQNVPSKPVL
jgi:hypothetical protein